MAQEREKINFTQNNELILAVREITKNYGSLKAVHNLTFGVRQTDCFGLLGNNF